MNTTFTFDEVLNRCQKRNTQIRQFSPTANDVTILVFTDGTQATVDEATLARITDELPRKHFAKDVHTLLPTE